jgi:hypothetical protein
MATFRDYLTIARTAYEGAADAPPTLGLHGWSVQKWEFGTWYGNGFQGGVFASDAEVVVGISGTKGGPTTAPISQNLANAKIGLNCIPTMADAAYFMVRWAQKLAAGRPVSIVGHSLGGGLAQVVGNWAGCPFVSVNGPGMKTHLRASAFNVFRRQQMIRSILSANADDTVGLFLYVRDDFTGTFGSPVGLAVDLGASRAGENPHDMETVERLLRAKGWLNRTPRQVYGIWPA